MAKAMNWIKSYEVYKVNESTSFKSYKTVFELCVGMLLLNEDFLNKILDQGLKARYTENSSVFVQDLKNLLFGNNRLKVGILNESGDRYEELKELGSANYHFNNMEDGFNIERDWNYLVKARNIARNIQDKLLFDTKLSSDDIKQILWTTPNKERGEKEVLVIETKDDNQYCIALDKFNLTKTQSFNTLLETLVGEVNIHNEQYQPRWDKLAQEWLRLVYEKAKPSLKVEMKKYIDPDRFYSITWENYFKIKHFDKQFKHLGEYVELFNKNITSLHDLMTNMYKNIELSFEDNSIIAEWEEIKKHVLTSGVLEHIISSEFDKEEGEEVGDFIKATDSSKQRIMKVMLEILSVKERDLNYFHLDNFYKVPNKQFYRNNFEDFDLLYDFHVKLTSESDSIFRMVMNYKGKELLKMDLDTNWSGGEMSGKLSTKIKVTVSEDYNTQLLS
jgi:hypothetical protein